MKFKDLLSEYYSGRTEDRIIRKLKIEGFHCKSNPEEVRDMIISLNLSRLTTMDVDEIIETFFSDEMKCSRGILDKLFGAKAR